MWSNMLFRASRSGRFAPCLLCTALVGRRTSRDLRSRTGLRSRTALLSNPVWKRQQRRPLRCRCPPGTRPGTGRRRRLVGEERTFRQPARRDRARAGGRWASAASWSPPRASRSPPGRAGRGLSGTLPRWTSRRSPSRSHRNWPKASSAPGTASNWGPTKRSQRGSCLPSRIFLNNFSKFY